MASEGNNTRAGEFVSAGWSTCVGKDVHLYESRHSILLGSATTATVGAVPQNSSDAARVDGPSTSW